MMELRLGDFMSRSPSLLTDEDRALLLKVSSLLEEIIETLAIIEDKEAMKSIREAEEDVEKGRIRDYEEFVKGLKESSETQYYRSSSLVNRILLIQSKSLLKPNLLRIKKCLPKMISWKD